MAAKTGIAQFAQGRVDVFRVDPDDIHVMPDFNARNFDDPANKAHIEELAASIAENGVKVPLRVRLKDKLIYLVDGECRLRAAKLARQQGAELKSVPVISEDRYASEADLVMTQITANSGKGFTPLEKAKVFKRLLALGWDEGEIARKAGITRVRVVQLLELTAAPAEVTQMVGQGKISATLAIEALRDAKGDDQKVVETLRAGIESAERAGKEKATKKDLPKPGTDPAATPKLSMKAQRDRLLDLLEAALDNDPDKRWLREQLKSLKEEAGLLRPA